MQEGLDAAARAEAARGAHGSAADAQAAGADSRSSSSAASAQDDTQHGLEQHDDADVPAAEEGGVRRSKRISVQRTHETHYYAGRGADSAEVYATAGPTDDYGVNYDVLEIVQSSRFKEFPILGMEGKDFDLAFVCRTGLRQPMRFRNKDGLGIQVPPSTFTIDNVREYVGNNRIVDVMDVPTQEALTMTMKEWTEYYNDPHRSSLLNVISLEFSKTRLDPLVKAPAVVRQIDWVDIVWPADLKAQQVETTNRTDAMKYPKVQKYCLMSVEGCFTDFHVDFGGSSVWYHVLWGAKLFWLVEPTERNLKLFERWSKGNQQAIFFGDLCPDDCMVVNLKAGDTFMIPTGWIHAVYTPQDSLVFGGNFMHGFNIDGQLQVAALEQRLRVPLPYRFPFFQPLMWYGATRYSEALAVMLDRGTNVGPAGSVLAGRSLTSFELNGLTELASHLSVWLASPAHRDSIPDRIGDPRELVAELRRLLALAKERWGAAVSEGALTVSTDANRVRDNDQSVDFLDDDGIVSSADTFQAENKQVSATSAVIMPRVDEDELAARYAQLKAVRESVLQAQPNLSADEVTEVARKEWHAMPQETRRVFRDMLRDEMIFQSAVTGEVRDKAEVLGAARKSKYEGQRWRPDLSHIARAKALRANAGAAKSRETEEQRKERLQRARALLIGMAPDTQFGNPANRGTGIGSVQMLNKMASIKIRPVAAKKSAEESGGGASTNGRLPLPPPPPPSEFRPPREPPPPRNRELDDERDRERAQRERERDDRQRRRFVPDPPPPARRSEYEPRSSVSAPRREGAEKEPLSKSYKTEDAHHGRSGPRTPPLVGGAPPPPPPQLSTSRLGDSSIQSGATSSPSSSWPLHPTAHCAVSASGPPLPPPQAAGPAPTPTPSGAPPPPPQWSIMPPPAAPSGAPPPPAMYYATPYYVAYTPAPPAAPAIVGYPPLHSPAYVSWPPPLPLPQSVAPVASEPPVGVVAPPAVPVPPVLPPEGHRWAKVDPAWQ